MDKEKEWSLGFCATRLCVCMCAQIYSSVNLRFRESPKAGEVERLKELGLVGPICHLSTQRLRQRNHKFGESLGYEQIKTLSKRANGGK